MPAYQSEVLADTPIGYWRLSELTGTTFADSSGNGRALSVYTHPSYPTTTPTLGRPSPIETDPADRAIGTFAPFAGSTASLFSAAAAFKLTGTFSYEAWAKWDTSVSAIIDGIVMSQLASFENGTHIEYRNGQWKCYVVFGTIPTTTLYSLTANVAAIPGTYYHLVMTRSTNVLRFYVNGVLAAERTDLPIGAMTTGADNFSVGGIPQYGSVFQGDIDEVAIYNTALSAARVLAHYEAALATLPLRATITVRLGLELDTDQITPEDLPFAHNYAETFGDSHVPIVEEVAYQTLVTQSEPDYQQRVNARPHGPHRALEYHLSPSAGAARSRLRGALHGPARTYRLPVWTDSGLTTAEASAGANTISLDTTRRDYEVGSHVGVGTDLQDPATYQFFKITAVADAQLTLSTNLATTLPAASFVFPARLATLSDDSLAVKSSAADHEDQILRFEVLETELSTRRLTPYTPGVTYKAIEVFSLEAAKVHFLDARPFDLTRRLQARGRDYQYARDTGSPQTFPVRFLLATRAALAEFHGWLDARQGRQNPLWVSTRERDLTVTARPSSTTLTVTKTGFAFHHARRDIEFLLTDGTHSRKRVTGVADNGATETWTFDDGVPALATISRASFLRYCTQAGDVTQLRHYKGGAAGAVVSEAVVQFRELLTSPA